MVARDHHQRVLRDDQGKPILTAEDYASLNPRQHALIEWLVEANREFRTHNRIIAVLLMTNNKACRAPDVIIHERSTKKDTK